MSKTQWCAKPKNPVSNESMARLFAAFGLSAEGETCVLYDKEGRSHEIWFVPSGLITRLRAASRTDQDRIKHQFRFFVQNTPGGPIHPMDFLEKKRPTVKVRNARARLAEHLSKGGKVH